MTSAELRQIAPDVAAKLLGEERKRPKPRGTGQASTRKSKSIGNQWEQDYAVQLNCRGAAGEITCYYAQAMKFRLADATWYTPDFIVFLIGGGIEAVEVKGWQRDDAIVKFKVAAESYKNIVWRMVTKNSAGGWRTTRLLNAAGGVS